MRKKEGMKMEKMDEIKPNFKKESKNVQYTNQLCPKENRRVKGPSQKTKQCKPKQRKMQKEIQREM